MSGRRRNDLACLATAGISIDLDPDLAPAGNTHRALAHDAFEFELAGVPEHDFAIAGMTFGEMPSGLAKSWAHPGAAINQTLHAGCPCHRAQAD